MNFPLFNENNFFWIKDFDFILQEKEILGINFNFIKLKKILAENNPAVVCSNLLRLKERQLLKELDDFKQYAQ